ncbi:YHYH protein [Verrucomicrobiales bacterium]|nr:YHYH protein [Verrucomicrobiales bacterium]
MKRLGFTNGEHSAIIGWAADGFPIYALYGYSDPMEASSAIEEMKTGYALKKGERLGGRNSPDGSYDGAFAEDYEYVGGVGTFDECNGRFCVKPEFPSGTYAYFMTQEWPVIPRAFRGTPEQFKTFRGGEGPGGSDRRGGLPRGGPPPRQ